MIIGWIIQPQIDKLVAQKNQLNSLRVDIKVEILFIKKDFSFNGIMAVADSFFRRNNINQKNK